jgi:hypothetical protein
MAEVKELKENEFEFENGIVSVEFGWDYVTGKEVVKRFKYNDVDSEAIQKLSKDLYNKLKDEVDKFAIKYFEAKKQKELEEQKKRLEEQKKALEEFKRKIEATELAKYSPEFVSEDKITLWSNVKIVSFDVGGKRVASLEQDGNNWLVTDAEYKTRRYTVFENAISRVKELITYYTNEYNRKQQKENALQNFADAVGMKLISYWKGSYGKHDSGYYVHALVPKNSEKYTADYELGLNVSYDNNKVSVSRLSVNKPIKFFGKIVNNLSLTFKTGLDVEETKQLIEEIKRAIAEAETS